MEIKDALSLYNFIEELGYLGGIVFSVFVALIAAYLVINVLDKISKNAKVKLRIVSGVLILVLVCMLVILLETKKRNRLVSEANIVKSYMVSQRWHFMGFKRMAREVNLSADRLALNAGENKDLENRVVYLKRLVNNFPNEFSIAAIWDADTTDNLGVVLIDTNAVNNISKYYDDMLPFFKAKIMNYMQTYKMDILTYVEIRRTIDARCSDDILDKLMIRYSDTFTPLNIYKNKDNTEWWLALKANRDSL